MTAAEITARARRIAALAAFLDTFDCPGDRLDVVQRLLNANIIRAETADLLIDEAGAA